jgi:hypothetical protein
LIRDKHSRSWFGYVITSTCEFTCHPSSFTIRARCSFVAAYLTGPTNITLLFISVEIIPRFDGHTALGNDLLKAVDSSSESVILSSTFNVASTDSQWPWV